MGWQRWLSTSTAIAVLWAAAGCGADTPGESDDGITFWTVLDTPAATAAMETIAAKFTGQTGIKVKVVGMKDAQMAQTIGAAAAAGTMPDVLLHIVDRTVGWAGQGLLDAQAATDVINELGRQTFNGSALRYVQDGDRFSAVPSDGWGQLLFYRKDLFDQAGLAVPDSYQAITAAAAALHGRDGVSGVVLGSKAGDRFTMQTFENMALANNCQLVDDAGQVALRSPQCVNAISWYVDLLRNRSVGGEQDTNSTRATYLAGKAAMVSWSPHLLDELAGAAPDMPPACAQCKDDPAWLARNTGIVPLLQGPDASRPAQYGQTSNLGITSGANVAAAKRFVSYLLSDAYLQFLDIQPEGRFPMRNGTAADAEQYLNSWSRLTVGADANAKTIDELYGPTVATLAKSANEFSRWGFSQGKGALESAVYGDLVMTRILNDAVTAAVTPQQAAEQLQAAAEQLAAKK
jgi:multiple sugar transport system substrate-binding protein